MINIKSFLKESVDDSAYFELRLRSQAIVMNCLEENADDLIYEDGVFAATFGTFKNAESYGELTLNNDFVDGYEIESLEYENGVTEYEVYVYILPELVQYSPTDTFVDDEGNYYDTEYDESDYEGEISEVRRRIKVNAKGRRRVKMQCNKGFKWDSSARVCRKITGAALATKRKAVRKMVRTKKSMGTALKMRVKRKTAKARRFRKGMGLK